MWDYNARVDTYCKVLYWSLTKWDVPSAVKRGTSARGSGNRNYMSLGNLKTIIKPSQSSSAYHNHTLAILNYVSDKTPSLKNLLFWSIKFYYNMCTLHTKCTYSSVKLDEF